VKREEEEEEAKERKAIDEGHLNPQTQMFKCQPPSAGHAQRR